MEETQQQTIVENQHGKVHRDSNDDSGSSGVPDGYSGDRARMVLDPSNHDTFFAVTPGSVNTEIGVIERIISCFLGIGFLFALIVSLAIVPAALVMHKIYEAIRRILFGKSR